ANRESNSICLMDRDTGKTRAMTTRAQTLSGLPAWDDQLLLIPIHTDARAETQPAADIAGEILRLRTDGHLVSRHSLPFAAARVRAHPRRPALLISSPKRAGIWLIDNAGGAPEQIPIEWPALYWGLWEVSTEGLLLARRVPGGAEIVRHDWSWSRPPERHQWPGIQLHDGGRLMWQPGENRLWLIHVERPYTQLRRASWPRP
ncbi:MAG: hypothetical protein ACPGJE_00495, partial [Wenzhouxiangellaceae bacterium]